MGYPKSRLQRYLDDENCGYLRILGFNGRGLELLKRIQHEGTLPVITKVSDYRTLLSGLSKEMFEFDIRATDTYVLGFPNPSQRYGNQDFSTPIVRA